MTKIILSVLLCVVLGCSSLLPEASSPSEECRRYDDSYLAWYAVGVASAGLAGATGTTGVLTATLGDEQGADIGLAASSAVFGVLATVAGILSGEYAERAVECQAIDEAGP